MSSLYGTWVGLGSPPEVQEDKVIPFDRLDPLRFADIEESYSFGVFEGQRYIRCAVCTLPTFIPDHLVNRYCPFCNVYHGARTGMKLHCFNSSLTRVIKLRLGLIPTDKRKP